MWTATLESVRGRIAELEKRHDTLMALLTVGVGLLYRMHIANGVFLNPEEAFHSLMAVGRSFGSLVFHPSIINHPPLHFLTIRLMQMIDPWELSLRMPSILAGAFFPLLIFFWLRRLAGSVPAWIALILLLFSPNLLFLSYQVRGYALVAFFLAAALLCFQNAVDRRSLPWLHACNVLLLLGLFTEHLAMFFCGVMGLWFLLFHFRSSARAMKIWWTLWQFVLLSVIVGFRLQRMLRKGLHNIDGDFAPTMRYVGSQYWGSEQNPLIFLWERTAYVFSYLLAANSALIGTVVVAVFAAGVWILIRQRKIGVAVFLCVPFALTAAAGMLRMYPYGNTRHDVHLMIPAAIGVAVALAPLFRRRVLGVWIVSAVIFPPAMLFVGPTDSGAVPRGHLLKGPFLEALDYIQQTIPPGSTFVCDKESRMVLSYYLDPKTPWPRTPYELSEVTAGYRIVSVHWLFRDFKDVSADVGAVRLHFGLGEVPVWVVDTGFICSSMVLWKEDPSIRARFLESKEFGLGTAVYLAPPTFGWVDPRPHENKWSSTSRLERDALLGR